MFRSALRRNAMKIRLVCVGKMREDYLLAAQREYQKRLSRFCTLEIIELEEEPLPKNASPAQETEALRREGERVLRATRGAEVLVALAIEGRMEDSPAFAVKLASLGNATICFVVGGSLGLCPDVKQKADLLLSFSKMTLPHCLFRIVLLEQIYRACKIAANQTYHK